MGILDTRQFLTLFIYFYISLIYPIVPFNLSFESLDSLQNPATYCQNSIYGSPCFDIPSSRCFPSSKNLQ